MATKDTLLSCLKEKKGHWVSGELLSNELAVSRAAVCKHIGKLRKEGYDIKSSTKKGYLFAGSPDRLLPNEIRDGLGTRIFGKGDILYFGQTDSTNTRAKELAGRMAPEGTVVVAEEQTSGRGRRERTWFSPKGHGIYASLILRPAMPASEAPRITLMTAVAVADALLSLAKMPVTIKWPNDILVNGKKLAGILTEISTEMDAVHHIVVGLGLNVSTPFERFPEDIRKKATSILIETGHQLPRVGVVRAYLEHFEVLYEELKRDGFGSIMQRWRKLSNVIGQRVTVEVIGKEYCGEVVAVDDDGVLVIRDDKGRSHRVICGDLNVNNRPEKRWLDDDPKGFL
jgi:BirA family biotin operon repressor/biotin-[acetyl-CoA-carboxylase] ligase